MRKIKLMYPMVAPPREITVYHKRTGADMEPTAMMPIFSFRQQLRDLLSEQAFADLSNSWSTPNGVCTMPTPAVYC